MAAEARPAITCTRADEKPTVAHRPQPNTAHTPAAGGGAEGPPARNESRAQRENTRHASERRNEETRQKKCAPERPPHARNSARATPGASLQSTLSPSMPASNIRGAVVYPAAHTAHTDGFANHATHSCLHAALTGLSSGARVAFKGEITAEPLRQCLHGLP